MERAAKQVPAAPPAIGVRAPHSITLLLVGAMASVMAMTGP